VAKGVGPEFKLQHYKKKKRKYMNKLSSGGDTICELEFWRKLT
jgi:hypothetical protein